MKPMITIKMVWLTKHEEGGEDEVGGGLGGHQVGANARNEDGHICSNLGKGDCAKGTSKVFPGFIWFS